MNDIYLKFPDQQTAEDLLSDYTGSIDVIGIIYKPTGEMLLGEDGEYPAMAPMDGWHVNLRTAESYPELDAYKVIPANPVRVWA